jgi:hypothetical protein
VEREDKVRRQIGARRVFPLLERAAEGARDRERYKGVAALCVCECRCRRFSDRSAASNVIRLP